MAFLKLSKPSISTFSKKRRLFKEKTNKMSPNYDASKSTSMFDVPNSDTDYSVDCIAIGEEIDDRVGQVRFADDDKGQSSSSSNSLVTSISYRPKTKKNEIRNFYYTHADYAGFMLKEHIRIEGQIARHGQRLDVGLIGVGGWIRDERIYFSKWVDLQVEPY